MGFKEIVEISKPRIVVLLVITAVTSMYAASKLVDGIPELDYWSYLHIIIAGTLASAGSSALNHYYDKDIDWWIKYFHAKISPCEKACKKPLSHQILRKKSSSLLKTQYLITL